jgi:hypothetical protein
MTGPLKQIQINLRVDDARQGKDQPDVIFTNTGSDIQRIAWPQFATRNHTNDGREVVQIYICNVRNVYSKNIDYIQYYAEYEGGGGR